MTPVRETGAFCNTGLQNSARAEFQVVIHRGSKRFYTRTDEKKEYETTALRTLASWSRAFCIGKLNSWPGFGTVIASVLLCRWNVSHGPPCNSNAMGGLGNQAALFSLSPQPANICRCNSTCAQVDDLRNPLNLFLRPTKQPDCSSSLAAHAGFSGRQSQFSNPR